MFRSFSENFFTLRTVRKTRAQIKKHSHTSEELHETITHQTTPTRSFEHSSSARLATDRK